MEHGTTPSRCRRYQDQVRVSVDQWQDLIPMVSMTANGVDHAYPSSPSIHLTYLLEVSTNSCKPLIFSNEFPRRLTAKVQLYQWYAGSRVDTEVGRADAEDGRLVAAGGTF